MRCGALQLDYLGRQTEAEQSQGSWVGQVVLAIRHQFRPVLGQGQLERVPAGGARAGGE